MTNDLLRDHVTGVAFQLTLGKTHIAALVDLDYDLRRNLTFEEMVNRGLHVIRLPKPFGSTGAMGGLVTRGLVIHTMPPKGSTLKLKPHRIWKITPAGRLVIRLLKETGVYQEYAAIVEQHFGAHMAKTGRDEAVAA